MILRDKYKQLKRIWTISLISMIFLYAFTIFPYRNTFFLIDKMYYYYKIIINSNNSSDWEVYFPVILEESGEISSVMNEIKSFGNYSSQIIDSSKGTALKLTGFGLIELEIDSLKTNQGTPYLSLTNYSNHLLSYFYDEQKPLPVWIYSNISNLNISCEFSYHSYCLDGLLLSTINYITWYHYLKTTTIIMDWNKLYFVIYVGFTE